MMFSRRGSKSASIVSDMPGIMRPALASIFVFFFLAEVEDRPGKHPSTVKTKIRGTSLLMGSMEIGIPLCVDLVNQVAGREMPLSPLQQFRHLLLAPLFREGTSRVKRATGWRMHGRRDLA